MFATLEDQRAKAQFEFRVPPATEAATQAYRKAWCDGPPFAYNWGCKAASAHLNPLGAPEPSDLPPYDESKHEPMPEVEIDPPDLPVESNLTEE